MSSNPTEVLVNLPLINCLQSGAEFLSKCVSRAVASECCLPLRGPRVQDEGCAVVSSDSSLRKPLKDLMPQTDGMKRTGLSISARKDNPSTGQRADFAKHCGKS